MITNDYNLFLKFQRRPKVIGTKCIYAPTNKLLIPPGIKPGDKVFICDYTQSTDDVYISVCSMDWWNDIILWTKDSCKEYIAGIPSDKKIMVIWKDLAQ